MVTDDVELNAPPQKKWTLTLIDAGDGSGDAIIPLPDDLLAFTGWAEGDVLSIELVGNCIKLTKDNNTPKQT